MAIERRETKKSARLAMMELSNLISVPMALTAVIRLNVPEAIWQSGSNAPLTAVEILSLLHHSSSSSSASNLQRLLRLLSTHNVFAEHIDGVHRRYSLTEIGQTLIADNGASFAAFILQHHQDALVRSWPLLHEAVMDPDGPEPFARANGGVSAYAFYDGAATDLMRSAMWGVSVPFMEDFLDEYKGFEGVETIVDVAGSSGKCLQMILERVGGVKAGINFDLPEVVAGAPEFPGVTHVGGDMFKSVPSGDAIFMKWVLNTWTEEECGLILKNCYDALPAGGKLVACEPVVPEETDGGRRARALLESDVFIMAMYRSQGKERTEKEFRRLGVAAGFSGFRAIYLDHFFTVLEFRK